MFFFLGALFFLSFCSQLSCAEGALLQAEEETCDQFDSAISHMMLRWIQVAFPCEKGEHPFNSFCNERFYADAKSFLSELLLHECIPSKIDSFVCCKKIRYKPQLQEVLAMMSALCMENTDRKHLLAQVQNLLDGVFCFLAKLKFQNPTEENWQAYAVKAMSAGGRVQEWAEKSTDPGAQELVRDFAFLVKNGYQNKRDVMAYLLNLAMVKNKFYTQRSEIQGFFGLFEMTKYPKGSVKEMEGETCDQFDSAISHMMLRWIQVAFPCEKGEHPFNSFCNERFYADAKSFLSELLLHECIPSKIDSFVCCKKIRYKPQLQEVLAMMSALCMENTDRKHLLAQVQNLLDGVFCFLAKLKFQNPTEENWQAYAVKAMSAGGRVQEWAEKSTDPGAQELVRDFAFLVKNGYQNKRDVMAYLLNLAMVKNKFYTQRSEIQGFFGLFEMTKYPKGSVKEALI